MKVSVELSSEYLEPFAVIYTDHVSEEIQRLMDVIGTNESPVTGWHNEELVILQPKEIYMVRVEDGETILYGEKQKYRSRKRLYEIGSQLGNQFIIDDPV